MAGPTSSPNSARQLAEQKARMLKMLQQEGIRGSEAEKMIKQGANTYVNVTTDKNSYGGGGQQSSGSPHRSYRSGGSVAFRFPQRPQHKIIAKPTLAETGSEVIKRQGGLSPSYGPSGINDTYRQGPVTAWQRLQDSKNMAQSGRPMDADRIEKANQLRGMGGERNFETAQGLQNQVNFNTAALNNTTNTPQSELFPTPQNAPTAAQDAQAAAVDWDNPEAYDPYFAENQEMDAYAKGGKVTGKAVVGEAGPETKFNHDGSIDKFTKPTVLNNAKPGIIVPNPELKKFLQKFNHPPKETVGVTPAFGMGGSLGLPAIGSTYGFQPQVIGLSQRGQGGLGGMTTVAGTIAAPELTDEEYYAMGMRPPERGMRTGFGLPAYPQNEQTPAYAEGGAYDENSEDNYRTDAQGNLWMRNPEKPDSGILLSAPQPVNQPMRRFLQSWKDPQNSGIVQDVDAYRQNLANLQAQTAQELQVPAMRTPTTITSKYGTGSVSQAAQPSMIEGLPADEFFQRQANRGGANKFAQPEADSAYTSAQRPEPLKTPSLAKTNPALFAQFENWRKNIKRGKI